METMDNVVIAQMSPQPVNSMQSNNSLSYLEHPNFKQFQKQAKNAFICGLVSLFILGFVLGIIAVVNALPAKKNLKAIGAPTSTATAGFVLGLIGIIGWAVALACMM